MVDVKEDYDSFILVDGEYQQLNNSQVIKSIERGELKMKEGTGLSAGTFRASASVSYLHSTRSVSFSLVVFNASRESAP